MRDMGSGGYVTCSRSRVWKGQLAVYSSAYEDVTRKEGSKCYGHPPSGQQFRSSQETFARATWQRFSWRDTPGEIEEGLEPPTSDGTASPVPHRRQQLRAGSSDLSRLGFHLSSIIFVLQNFFPQVSKLPVNCIFFSLS